MKTARMPSESDTEAPLQKASAGGGFTILLVEDHVELLTAVRQLLLSEEYQVLSASDGAEAVKLAAVQPGPIHLLLTDLAMPAMNGSEAARLMREARPGLRVLFMSGLHRVVAGLRTPEMDDAHFLEKPFTPSALFAKIKGLLAT